MVERLQAVPRHWLGTGLAAVVLVPVVTIMAAGGDGDRLAITEPTDARSTTSAATTTDSPAATTTSRPGTSTSAATSTTVGPPVTYDVEVAYRITIDDAVPAVEGRTVPDDPPEDEPPAVTVAPPPWADSTRSLAGGHLAADVGCAADTSAASIDVFLSKRVGPVLGWDYQHVYPLGGDRYLWLFQDVFLDHSGTKTTLGSSRFIHNGAMIQDGACFTLVHSGTADRPSPFENGDGSYDIQSKWLWPMGGELVGDRLYVFWAEMVKDPYDPDPPNGLGWHPRQVFLASYDAITLERRTWESPRNNGVTPIYGYAVASDDTHTYFFGNTFEQNMIREGGFWNGPHSATKMYLARVPRGKITEWPEYRTADGWSYAPEDAVPFLDRFYAENPMQPRYLDGQWVATTAVDGYWGDALAVDVADHPWGPWTTVQYGPLAPRNADPKMNTYHAQPLPWRDAFGSLQITVSNNARNMRRDAWDHPHRYRPMVTFSPYTPTPPPPTTTTTTTTTTVPPTTSTSTSTSTTTTVPPTTKPSTTTVPTTTTTTTTTSTSTSTSTTTTTTVPRTTTTTVPTSTTPPTTAAPPTTAPASVGPP